MRTKRHSLRAAADAAMPILRVERGQCPQLEFGADLRERTMDRRLAQRGHSSDVVPLATRWTVAKRVSFACGRAMGDDHDVIVTRKGGDLLVDRHRFHLKLSSASLDGCTFYPIGWYIVGWDGHFLRGNVESGYSEAVERFEAMIGPTLARVCAHLGDNHLETPPLWVVDAASSTDCTLLTAQHLLHLRRVPKVGEVFDFGAGQLEVVDGAEYATHSYPADQTSMGAPP